MIKIKLFITTALLLMLNSCIKHENRNYLQSKEPVEELKENKLNTNNGEHSLFYSDNKNQISQVVRTIFQDSKENLWFGTQDGAFKFDGDSLFHIEKIMTDSGKNPTIKEFTESKDGKIWVGHTDGVSSIDGDVVTNYSESDGLISNDVWSLAADKGGKIWIGTIDGVCFFNGKEFSKFALPEGKIDSTLGISSTKMIHDIFQDSKGTLWFSTNSGLFSYVNNSLTNVSEKVGIQTNFVNEVFENEKGKLWVSTKIGLYKLTDDKAINITKGKIETGKGIGSIAEDKDGNIWFVSNQHSLFTYSNEKLIEYKKTEFNKGPVVFQILKDQSNRIWFVGFGGPFRLENGKFVNVTKNGPW